MASDREGDLNFFQRAIERTIYTFSPQRAFERASARTAMEYFGYDAAHPGRLRGGSGGLHKNASAESPRMTTDRIKLMWDARDQVRQDPMLGGLVDRLVMYIIGKIAYQPRTGTPAIDRIYRDFFYDWCGRSDLTGRFRLKEQAALGLKGMMVDGDHGVNEVRAGNELRLQHVESDRIGDPLKVIGNFSDNYIQGIWLNQLGQPTGYDVYRRTRLAQYIFDRQVPVDQFIHLAMPDTSDKYRPASMLARVLPTSRDLFELIGFAKQQQKFASMFAGFLKPTDPYNKGGGAAAWDQVPADNKLGQIDAQAGLIKQIPAGYGDIIFAPGSNVPTGAFIQLFETCIRLIAQGLLLPYGFVWDMAVFGGVTARIELVQVDRALARFRQMLVDKMLDRVKNKVLALGIATGRIPAHPNFKIGKWNFGGRLTGDYGHDTQANIQKLQFGLTTATTLADEDGEEFEELVRNSASEIKFMQGVAAEQGVPIELLSQRFPNATQMLAAINTPPAPPPKGMVNIETEGVKPLLEVLGKVGEGVIDKDSAVNAIVQMYGVPRGRAEKMVPDGPGPAARWGAQGARKLATGGRGGKNGNRR